MPTELEELVDLFLSHGNSQIRGIAVENLVPYSTAQPSLFKRHQLKPVRDLKLLIKDYQPIAKNAIHILVNLTEDGEIVDDLISDDAFIESLLRRVTDAKDVNADELCMLLANLAKSPKITKLLTLKRQAPTALSASQLAIDQLLDAFVKGVSGQYNPKANYDYLSYVFADLAKHVEGQTYFLTLRSPNHSGSSTSLPPESQTMPLSDLLLFTEHSSTIRRRGVANSIKNATFSVSHHSLLLSPNSHNNVDFLPSILLPLMRGKDSYSDEDTEGMPEECQLLAPDKQREKQNDIICTHLDTLLLLTTTKEGRERLRECKVYPIIRELHSGVEDEGVQEGCDRLVQVLMRGEEGEEGGEGKGQVQEVGEEDEEDKVVEIL